MRGDLINMAASLTCMSSVGAREGGRDGAVELVGMSLHTQDDEEAGGSPKKPLEPVFEVNTNHINTKTSIHTPHASAHMIRHTLHTHHFFTSHTRIVRAHTSLIISHRWQRERDL